MFLGQVIAGGQELLSQSLAGLELIPRRPAARPPYTSNLALGVTRVNKSQRPSLGKLQTPTPTPIPISIPIPFAIPWIELNFGNWQTLAFAWQFHPPSALLIERESSGGHRDMQYPSVVSWLSLAAGPFMRRRNRVKSDTPETYIFQIQIRNRIGACNWFAFRPNDSDAGRLPATRRRLGSTSWQLHFTWIYASHSHRLAISFWAPTTAVITPDRWAFEF